MKQVLNILIISVIISSCGVPQADYDKLKAELEDCKYGADKILNSAKYNFKAQHYAFVIEDLNALMAKYPGSKESIEGQEILIQTNLALGKLEEKKQKFREAEELLKKEEAIKEKARLTKATSKMRKKYDDIQEITWYQDKDSPTYSNRNGFYCYIGDTGNFPSLRLKIQYAADDWLFIESYIIKVDGMTYTITQNEYGEIKTDNGSGGIWEWLDRSVGKDELEIIKAVAHGKDVKIRFQGNKYSKDKIITSAQKQSLRNVLDAFEALGGKFYF